MLRIGLMTETIYRFKGMKGALKLIKDLGFECADITFQRETEYKKMNPYFINKDYKEKAKRLKEYADKIKLPLVQAHAPFPSYFADNPRLNKIMWKQIIKTIEICGILKIKNLVVHPWNDFPNDVNIIFFKKLLPYAKKHNVTICCENMWRWNKNTNRAKPCSCSFAKSFNAIIDGVNSKYLKACVDIGHAEMFKHMKYSSRKMLEEMNKRVVCLHIHDNDNIEDKHWIPFRGKIDYKDVAKGLKNINYKGDLILEINGIKNIKTYKEGLSYWKEAYQAISKIRNMIIEK